MLKFENGTNYKSLTISMSKEGSTLSIDHLFNKEWTSEPGYVSIRSFDFEMQYDDETFKGVATCGDDAVWFPMEGKGKGIKVIIDNPKYHSLEETCVHMDKMMSIETPILAKLYWFEMDSCDKRNYIVSCYETVVGGNVPRFTDDDNFIPERDKPFVQRCLQGTTTINKQCIEQFYIHKLAPEDEWYKRQNLFGGKIIDCHRFRVIPERYNFNSNGKTPDELDIIYKKMVKRYLSIRDNMGLPKWKGKIYQGFVFDNGHIFHGYSSSNKVYDSYEKLPFMLLNKVKGKEVLDIGSNQGFFSFQAAIAGAKEVTGLEITKPDIEAANDIKKILQLDNVNFINTDAVKFLEETEKEFEVIIANSVIHQIYNNLEGAESMLDNIASKCKYFLFETPVNHTTMRIGLQEIALKLEEHFKFARLLHVYDAYSSGYRANFVCYS